MSINILVSLSLEYLFETERKFHVVEYQFDEALENFFTESFIKDVLRLEHLNEVELQKGCVSPKGTFSLVVKVYKESHAINKYEFNIFPNESSSDCARLFAFFSLFNRHEINSFRFALMSKIAIQDFSKELLKLSGFGNIPADKFCTLDANGIPLALQDEKKIE